MLDHWIPLHKNSITCCACQHVAWRAKVSTCRVLVGLPNVIIIALLLRLSVRECVCVRPFSSVHRCGQTTTPSLGIPPPPPPPPPPCPSHRDRSDGTVRPEVENKRRRRRRRDSEIGGPRRRGGASASSSSSRRRRGRTRSGLIVVREGRGRSINNLNMGDEGVHCRNSMKYCAGR